VARLFTVRLPAGVVTPLSLPTFALEELGVDDTGVLALSLDEVKDEEVVAGKTVVDGKEVKLEPVSEGLVALAHAWRPDGAGWKRVETKQTTTGWDYGAGVRLLDAYKAFGPGSAELLDAHAGDAGEADEALQKVLAPFKPKVGADEGTWGVWGTAPARLFAWRFTAEFTYSTGLVVLEGTAPTPAPKVGFTDGELVAIRTRGPFALVSSSHAGAHPRLYDAGKGTLVWSSDTARAVSFWP
jgi:hypothetical protein